MVLVHETYCALQLYEVSFKWLNGCQVTETLSYCALQLYEVLFK